MYRSDFESGVQTSAPFSLSASVIFFGLFPSGSLIQISSRPDRSDTYATYVPSADHRGNWLRDAILSGATRVMSPRSVAIVRICPRAEMTARRPDGEMSNASTSSVTVSMSLSLSFSSAAISILISLLFPVATSSFQMPNSSSYTITLPSLDIDGQNRLPSTWRVTCTGWPPPAGTL